MSDLCVLSGQLPTGEPARGSSASSQDGELRVSVMVVDNQALFRSGLVRLLEDDVRLRVVALSRGGADVPEACLALGVDVVVTELQLAPVDGIELTRLVCQVSPRTRVLILASSADSRVLPALTSGAGGFMLKDAKPEAIRAAVLSVYLGEQVLCAEAAEWLVGAAAKEGGPGHRRLTKRETEVLRLVAEGIPNERIAASLRLSDKTVRNYVSRLYRKLALRGRAQLAVYALQSGVVETIKEAR